MAEEWVGIATTKGAWQPYQHPDGFADLLGPFWMIEHEGTDGEVLRLGLKVQPKHCNRMGICHGGVLSTIADNAMGLNSNRASGIAAPTPTISLSLDFLKPAPLGAWIESRTRVVQLTGSLCFVDGSIVSGDDVLVRCNALFKRHKPDTTGRFKWPPEAEQAS